MKRKIGITAIIVLVLAGAVLGTVTALGDNPWFSLGQSWRKSVDSGHGQVVATYKGQEVLLSEVRYLQQTSADTVTDREAAERLIEGMILLEEAQARGLAATEAEIQEMVDMAKEAYSMPEGKELLDNYCAGAGLTLEAYYELLRAQAPQTIARQKLRDALGKAYCEEHGLTFTKVNPPPEIGQAVDAYIAQLVEAHAEDIEYFIT